MDAETDRENLAFVVAQEKGLRLVKEPSAETFHVDEPESWREGYTLRDAETNQVVVRNLSVGADHLTLEEIEAWLGL